MASKNFEKYNTNEILSIARKIDQLNLWDMAEANNWALKPRGSVFPYFCMSLQESDSPVCVRLLLLEGWQTMHDWVSLRLDPDYGIYLSWVELPGFEVTYMQSGDILITRHDPGYFPWYLKPEHEELLKRMLWEIYGVMLRQEADRALPLKYAEERSLFSRIEVAPNVWEDAPLAIPKPPPYVEKVDIPAVLIKRAKTLPVDKKLKVAIDLRVSMERYSPEVPPLRVYALKLVDLTTRELLLSKKATIDLAEGNLKDLWQDMPDCLLERLVDLGRLPCEIQVVSGRVFRFLRPVFLDLSVKLSKLEEIPVLEECFKKS